jgi:glutamate:Na+ symporter, ESS family
MEFDVIDGLRTVKLDLIFTFALAAIALWVGSALGRKVGFLARSNIPAPAIGGLLFAFLVLLLRSGASYGVALDTTLRTPLQTAFFSTIGLGASLSLLRAGGSRMALFWGLASFTAVVQNFVGMAVAKAIGAPVALGIIGGALTLTGGPATGLTFTPVFEEKGIVGAGSLIIASATFGIFLSSLVGNPVATWLIRRHRLVPAKVESASEGMASVAIVETTTMVAEGTGETLTPAQVLRHVMILLLVMGLGAVVSLGFTWLSGVLPPGIGMLFKLPGYIGAMIVAAVVRNLDDKYRFLRLDMKAVEVLGAVALALFLALALMDLKLWQLAGLALPLLVILAVQVLVMVAYACLVTFPLMGRDYEAAVTASGHVGFGLGIASNAVANMEALVERYAPAPRSFLVVPVVAGFFIDFSNSLIIQLFVKLVG